MKEPQKNPNKKPRQFQEFKTFGDKGLERMLEFGKRFTVAVTAGVVSPYWLSYCGPSGIGKTFISDIILDKLSSVKRVQRHATLKVGVRKFHWPTLVTNLFNRQSWMIDEAIDSNVLVLDEIACSVDNKGIEREWLWRIVSARVGKWTLITSNHSIEQIAVDIDARIASRMIRDGSVVIETVTKDFSSR